MSQDINYILNRAIWIKTIGMAKYEMLQEFPEIAPNYLALMAEINGEDEEVCVAIRDSFLPFDPIYKICNINPYKFGQLNSYEKELREKNLKIKNLKNLYSN